MANFLNKENGKIGDASFVNPQQSEISLGNQNFTTLARIMFCLLSPFWMIYSVHYFAIKSYCHGQKQFPPTEFLVFLVICVIDCNIFLSDLKTRSNVPLILQQSKQKFKDEVPWHATSTHSFITKKSQCYHKTYKFNSDREKATWNCEIHFEICSYCLGLS